MAGALQHQRHVFGGWLVAVGLSVGVCDVHRDLVTTTGAVHRFGVACRTLLGPFSLLEGSHVAIGHFEDGSPDRASAGRPDVWKRTVPRFGHDREVELPLGKVCDELEFRARGDFLETCRSDTCGICEVEQDRTPLPAQVFRPRVSTATDSSRPSAFASCRAAPGTETETATSYHQSGGNRPPVHEASKVMKQNPEAIDLDTAEPDPFDDVYEILTAPINEERPWMVFGACRETDDPDMFFSPNKEQARAALALCATCPVRTDCLEYALDARERFGIWGGTTEKQRRKLLRRTA